MGLGFRLLVSDGDNYARNAVASYLSGVERMSYIFSRYILVKDRACRRLRLLIMTTSLRSYWYWALSGTADIVSLLCTVVSSTRVPCKTRASHRSDSKVFNVSQD